MVSPRPFRALRFQAARIDLGRVLGVHSDDPRRATRLLEDRAAPGDGTHGAARRARFRLADWRRAGIVARDREPSMTLVKRGEALGLLCALPVSAFSGTDPPHEVAREQWLDHTCLAVEPIVASFAGDARVRRVLDNAADREADASWTDGDVAFELWVVDDETTAARLATMLGGEALELRSGAELLAAHAAFAARRTRSRDDDRAPASSFALCFLHPAEDDWPSVPRGAALLPLDGTL